MNRAFQVSPIVLLCLMSGPTPAQQWPSKPVHVIVYQSASSGPDVLMRLVAEKLQKSLNQPFLVENRTGADGLIGASAAAKAPADGYNYFMGNQDTHAANLFKYRSLPYDPDRDFTPVATVVDSMPLILTVHRDVPASTLPELIGYAKSNPGKLSSGVTVGVIDVMARWMNVVTGSNILVVPYKESTQVGTDLLSGQIQMAPRTLFQVEQFVKAGKLRMLAVSSSKRLPQIPDVPTLAESYPGLVIEPWMFLVAPTGIPADVVQRANREVDRAIKDPEVIAKIQGFGFAAGDAGTPKSVQDRILATRATWKRIAQDLGIKPE